ncbi:hypothetical protein FRC06_008337, partial [Ceratobasidium sp. 370]
MDVAVASPPSSLVGRKSRTYAQVAASMGNNPNFNEVLGAFREFLANQEVAKLSKNQLELFRGLITLVLETSISAAKNEEDISDILSISATILHTVSLSLKSKTHLDAVIKNPKAPSDLESDIREGFEGLETQLRKLGQAGLVSLNTSVNELESVMYKEELAKAQQRDRAKIEELKAIVKQTPQLGDGLGPIIQISMEENLQIIGGHTAGQKHFQAKQTLAILTELTGKSLPPSTSLDRDFVTIGQRTIHQGANYDIFLGEYFTGEKIAIKVLKHCVNEETAKNTHERFARQASNWSLQHDTILPLYGSGITPSSVVSGEFQSYMVSPYLQNQDARQYLNKYSQTSKEARLQM